MKQIKGAISEAEEPFSRREVEFNLDDVLERGTTSNRSKNLTKFKELFLLRHELTVPGSFDRLRQKISNKIHNQ